MRSRLDQPRPSALARLGIIGAVTLCWFSGLTARRQHLSIGDVPYRDDFQVAAASGLAIATVLALGLLALAVLRAPWWLLLATAAAAAHHVVLALAAFQHSLSAPVDHDFGYSAVGQAVTDGVADGLMPGSWPLAVMVLAAAVALLRGPRATAPRPLNGPARAVIIAAFLLASLTGLVGWYLEVYFIFVGGPEPADYQNAIVIAAGTAGLLLLGVLVVWLRWGMWSQVWPAAFGVLVQVFVALSCRSGAQGAPDPALISPDPVQVRYSLEYVALLPPSWPLLLVLAWAVVTATPALRRSAGGTGRVTPWSHRPWRLQADAS